MATPTGTYDFTYIVNNGFCPADSALVSVSIVSCLGVDNNDGISVAVYPNPVKDILTIENLTTNANAIIEVVNAQGKVVISKTANSAIVTVDVSELAKGVYYLNVTSESTTQKISIIKQ